MLPKYRITSWTKLVRCKLRLVKVVTGSVEPIPDTDTGIGIFFCSPISVTVAVLIHSHVLESVPV